MPAFDPDEKNKKITLDEIEHELARSRARRAPSAHLA